MDNRNEMLKKIQSFKFALVELNLYLDTHPKDTRALEMFKCLSKKCKEMVAEYEHMFHALTADSVDSDDCWTWLDSPWPWENCKEG